jgi:N-acetyl-1-D-myo-inositol-2-amino-2-deoxy-alpha-D-glucopyranoside deacetylase
MAKAVQAGHRVVLVTCTRGELGEIVVPAMDTPDNHRRLGEIRAGELEAAMGVLGVTEWENLGYRDSGMMDDAGNRDPRSFWQADLDEAARRLTWLIRNYRPDVVTTYNSFGGYGHPDHIRTHDVAVRAFPRAGDPTWYPEQLEGDIEPWAPSKLYEQAIPASVRNAMNERLKELGVESFWLPPKDATPEQLAEFEGRMAQMLVPDESITTWVDIGDSVDAKWEAIRRHVTQISDDSPFMRFGLDGWRQFWAKEAYILTESRVETRRPESDLFEGLN